MNGAVRGDATPGVKPGRSRSQPTTSTVDERDARERDEWRAAGQVATGLERAMIALGLASSRTTHAYAEGIAYD